jgi:hypothetical protein
MSVHLQKIAVAYEYPVYFTANLFAVHTLDLVEAVARKEPGRRHAALDAFPAAGIRIAKVRLSAGLAVPLGDTDPAALRALRPFAEGVYLHQVVERRDGKLTRFLDLPEALSAAATAKPGPREWHVHFHVPLFRRELGPFLSTQDYLGDVLALLARENRSGHLEVETYTWDVLPEEYRREDIVTAVARELHWVMERLPA